MENKLTRFTRQVKHSNLKEAKHILEDFIHENDETMLGYLHELALAPDPIAWDLLLCLVNKKIDSSTIYDRLIQLILDRSHLNFGFIPILFKTNDKKKITQAAPLLKHILSKETDTGILVETIRAIGRTRIEILVDGVAEYLYFDNLELKAQAVKALERIGSDQALTRLEEAASTIKCDQNILDAIAVLKPEKNTTGSSQPGKSTDTDEAESLILYTNLESVDIKKRFEAYTGIADKGALRLKNLAVNLKSDNHDLVINSLRIMARTLPEQLIGSIFDLLDSQANDKSIQFAAYETLAAFPVIESAAAIIKGIDSPSAQVRMAALKVLDKNLTDFVCAEIKNRIESGGDNGALLAETIMDVKAKNIIQFLMVSDTFSYVVSNYLAKRSPLSPLKAYIDILKNRNLKSTARKFEDIIADKDMDSRPSAMVISSVTTIRRFYEKMLFSGGYGPATFGSAQDAFETATASKPDLILSDLFFNTMTGLDLAREIRGFYSKKDLPIIISTRQRDYIQGSMDDQWNVVGINGVLEFPGILSNIKACIHG